MKILECVPNFSEGRNTEIIEAIGSVIKNISHVKLLDVDSGIDTNRTVMTFVGNPEAVIEAAYASINCASKLIDMTKHTGAHARMGATDVCPFIPISDISMEECIEYSKTLAKRVGKELNIPIFLYDKSSTNELRKNLANIRQGEFEGMVEKLKLKIWKPDYGPVKIHKTAGATAIGARQFLIAYNINLNTMDKTIASDIALDIREAGRAKRDKSNKILRDKSGRIIKVPGTLKSTKAVGWYLEEFKIAQVSMNLVDYTITSLERAFEEIRKQARKRGVRVTGSEIVGLLPIDALLDAGLFYLKKQNRSIGIPKKEILHVAIKSLGLDDLYNFDIDNKIIEYLVSEKYGKLVILKLHDFIDELSTNSPAPGGGSVSALSGALSASLTSMVANLTIGKKDFIDKFKYMSTIAYEAQRLKERMVYLIDEDTNSFENVMKAFKLSKKTDQQILIRNKAIEDSTKTATEVPFEILQLCVSALKIAIKVAKKGNINSLSDSGVAGVMAAAGARGAAMNVKINLESIKDTDYKNKKTKYVQKYLSNINVYEKQLKDILKNLI